MNDGPNDDDSASRPTLLGRARSAGRFVRNVVGDFLSDECPALAAAISYYTIFAMPPLLGLLTLLASAFVDPDAVREIASEQVESVVGVESAAEIVDVVEGVTQPDLSGPTAIFGLVAIVLGATGGFVHLQTALNKAWRVAPDPKGSDVRSFLMKRVVSLAMMASIGLLLLTTLVLSTGLSAFEGLIRQHAPAWLESSTLQALDVGISFTIVTLAFTLVLRYVPDAVVRWRDAVVGGAVTGLLFTVGKQVIGYYLGRSDPGTVYGAAGSLAVAMLWIYYSALILLLGAEFTEGWARRKGAPIVPQRGAVAVRRTFGEAGG